MLRLPRTLRLHGSACCQLCRLRAAPRSRQLPTPSLRQAHLPRWLSDAFVACRRLCSSRSAFICTISGTNNHDLISSSQAHTGPGFAGRTAHRSLTAPMDRAINASRQCSHGRHASLQVPRAGVPSAASCLASLIMHPYLDIASRRDTLRGLTALAQACSQLSSTSFAGSLLAACGGLPAYAI